MRQFTNGDSQFKDGILAFDKRNQVPLYKIHQTSGDKRLYSYLILDFNLTKNILLKDFIIEKSIEVDININTAQGQPVKKAFICPVKMPERINYINSQYFTLGLSAICSFAFERPVISTKNDDYNRFDIADSHELKEIGVEFPTTLRGPGSKGSRVHNEIIDLWVNRVKEVVNLLDILTAKENNNYPINYEDLMQSFRLIQLAHINKKEDFDLGYSFLIAGIEAISQLAIGKINFSSKHKQHNEWKKLSKTNEIVKSFFKEYLTVKAYVDSEITNRDLNKRFVKFLISYNRHTDWEEVLYDELVEEGPQYILKYPNEINGNRELSPNNLSKEEFEKIIRSTYNLRSKFFHAGKPLPHKSPKNSSNNRFFQIIDNQKRRKALFEKMEKENRIESPFEEYSKIQDKLITFELMSNMARNSITNYATKALKNDA